MMRSRIFGIVWVILAFLYYIVSDFWLAPVILAVSAGVCVYLLLCVLPGIRFLEWNLQAEEEVMKRMPAACRLTIKNRSVLPLARAKITISFYNVMNGETEETELFTSVGGKKTECFSWQMKSRYVGQTEISVSKVEIYDFLGIFKRTADAGLKTLICVTPETFFSSIDITNRSVANMDSDYYSDTKKGYDSGETFGIREYVPGDSTKFIHWKLSSKLDKVLIRELGFPIQNSVLVLLETGWQREAPSPAGIDAMAEAFVSVAYSLCDCGLEPHLCFFDHAQAQLLDYEITDRESAVAFAGTVLSTPIVQDEMSVISHYLEVYGECKAAHVVYITDHMAAGEEKPLLLGSCVTVLKYAAENTFEDDSMVPSGISLVPFYETSVKEDLCQLNI